MEQICKYDQCTGCSACINICPKSAITMTAQGPLGDIHPSINQDLCINCHFCTKICPINNLVYKKYPLNAYALIAKDKEDLLSSSSGGASSLLAQAAIVDGGVVYGCVENDYQDIAHRRIDSISDLPLIKKSKYVQSDINYIYKDVRKDTIEGRHVLFLGTPCQVAGLKSYLQKDYENILLVDLVCHGVPSQKLLRQDVERRLDSIGADHDGVTAKFREKEGTSGKKDGVNIIFGLFLKDKNGRDILFRDSGRVGDDFYITAFFNGLIFRDCCYHCEYARPERVGDITIADFWGIGETSVPKGNGISLVLVNTSRGKKAFERITSNARFEERNIEEGIKGNRNLQCPSILPPERNKFISEYIVDNDNACNRYMRPIHRKRRLVRLLSKLHLLSLASRSKAKLINK